MRNDKENIIVNKSFDFAINIIEFSEKIFEFKRSALANQIFKPGTSIGANIKESQNAESKNDFVHKLKIAAKEADETEYWLNISLESNHYPGPDEKLLLNLREIILILSKIIATTKCSS